MHANTINAAAWAQKASHFMDHNLYQTWEYQEARTTGNTQTLQAVEITDANDTPRALALGRIIRVPIIGLRIAYVQWGPLLRRSNESIDMNTEALIHLRNYFFSHNIDVLRIAPNIYTAEVPLCHREALSTAGFDSVDHIKPYRTILFPLEIDEERILLTFHKNWRNRLRKAEKQGLNSYESRNAKLLTDFSQIYALEQKRKQFKGLDIDLFVRAHEQSPPERKLNIVAVQKEDQLLCVDVNSYLGDTSLGLFQSSTDAGRSLGASYLAWWHSFLAAKHAGMRRYDMGGIDPTGNPAVYHFKKQMGGQEALHLGYFNAYANSMAKRFYLFADKIYYKIKSNE